ncbi:uncharacterized protein [Aphelocoma coerulescens]|uniref:uncharacterized protein isoform X3 n=1 Tax=Aphelocoma coerulescens TaxID=39617 RepID=UPI00360543A0
MNKRKDHPDSSGAGSQGQKSPGKAQEEDLTSPEAPSHLEVQGLPVLVKSLWRSTQKSCHPKSRLANSLRRSCLEVLHPSSDFCCIFPYSCKAPKHLQEQAEGGNSCSRSPFGSWMRRECHGQGGITKVQVVFQGNTSCVCHLYTRWLLPSKDKRSEYVPKELGLAIWQHTFLRKSCRMLLLLLSSVPKEGTIHALPALLQP